MGKIYKIAGAQRKMHSKGRGLGKGRDKILEVQGWDKLDQERTCKQGEFGCYIKKQQKANKVLSRGVE